MKAEDLMVGDWVNLYGEPIKINIDDLCTIDRDETYDNGVHCKPILITPEILEKNGYKRGLLIHEYKISDGLYYDLECGILLFGYEHGTVLEINCNYVHELQHTLKLCGIEKEIVL